MRIKEVSIMSKKLSCIIADFLCGENAISKEDREMYEYGFQMLFYGVEQAVILVTLGIINNMLKLTVLFLFVLISLRKYSGGYHSKTRIGCTFTTVAMYGIVMFISKYGLNDMNQWLISFICIFFYFLSFFLYAPVEHENKPLNHCQVKQYRRKGMHISIIWATIAIACGTTFPDVKCCIISTMVIVAISMVVPVKNRR